MSTERDDNSDGSSVERSDEGVAGTAHRYDDGAGEQQLAHGPEHAREHEDDDAPEAGPRGRHRSRLAVGAVALAVLLAGGGGAYWATTADDSGDNAAHGTPAPLRVAGPDVPVRGSTSGTGPGGATYQLTGKLPKGPQDAAVYRPAADVDKAEVQHLATLLGMSDPVRSDAGTWRVGGTSGVGEPALLVSQDGPGTWTYTRNGPPAAPAHLDGTGTSGDSTSSSSASGNASAPVSGDPSSTVVVGSGPIARPADAGPSGPGTAGPGAAGPGDSGTPPVSAQRAETVAAPVLKGLGLGSARVGAAETVGATRTVTADPVVGGLPTHGWSTSLQVGPDGILTMASGRLAALDKGDTYPVVSAGTAFKQLNVATAEHPERGVAGCARPMIQPQEQSATPTVPGQDKTLPHSRPCVPGNGHPTQVRGATFGLSLQFVAGVQTLVPSWLFDTAPAGVSTTAVVAELAVDPAYIEPGGPALPGAPSGPVDPGGPVVPVQPVQPSPPSGPTRPGVPARPADPAPTGHTVKVSGYQVDGSTLSVTFYGGLCNAYHVRADETGDQVRVTVTAGPDGKQHEACPMIARAFTQKVVLHQPLGNRTVVDALDGQPVKGQ